MLYKARLIRNVILHVVVKQYCFDPACVTETRLGTDEVVLLTQLALLSYLGLHQSQTGCWSGGAILIQDDFSFQMNCARNH